MASGYVPLMTNSSNHDTSPSNANEISMGPALALFFSILGFSTVAIAAVGNLSILLVFITVPKLRTHINYFFASLALSDFIQAVFYLPLEVEYHTRKVFIHSLAVCDFMYVLFFLTFTSSALNLLAVSAYRYVTICLPFRSESFKKLHVVLVILTIWLYSILVALLPVMGWRPKETEVTKELDCYYMFEPAYAIFVTTANWLIPAVTGFILYALMFRISKMHADEIARNQVPSMAERRWKYLFKGAKRLSTIAVVYLVCWFPYVIEVLLVTSKVVKSNQILHYFFVYLCYINSAINPFLYAGLCWDFKEVFFGLYTRCKQSCCNYLSETASTIEGSQYSRSQNAINLQVRYSSQAIR